MNKKVLKTAIDYYGKNHQIDIAIEEMSELIKALLKYKRAFFDDHSSENSKEQSIKDINEEMGDVIICLEELKIIFNNKSKIEKIIKEKIDRLSHSTSIFKKIYEQKYRN